MPHANPEIQRQAVRRIQNGKRAEYRQFKESMPCTDCGLTFPYFVTEFHHRDPATKRFIIGNRSASFGSALVTAEIAKCDLLCANCHRIRTYTQE